MSYKNAKGIWVSIDVIWCESSAFEGTADEVNSYVTSIYAQALEKGMVSEGRFDISCSNDYYGDVEVRIKYEFERPETPKELASREAREAKEKEKRAAKRKATAEKKRLKADAEYSEFLRLKEKFKGISDNE